MTRTQRDADSGGQRRIVCANPATGEHLGMVPAMDADAVRHVVERARAAQPLWAETSFAQRRAVLRSLLREIVANQERICRDAVEDSGKTMVDAVMGEIFPVCEKLRYVIRHGERDLAPEQRRSGFLLHKRAQVTYHPLGVIGVICPWNFPFHNVLCPLIPALFAGNAVVAKISEWSSWSADATLELIHDVLRRHGQHADLVQLVCGYGDTGAHLVNSGVDKVFFTGSPQTGKQVMATAAGSLTPVVLELGGKDPMIICEDANVDHAVDQALLGVYTACGQMCVGAERIYVHDAVYDRFVDSVLNRVAQLRQGPPLGATLVDVGATTMPAQLDKIDALLADAVEKGARVLIGGRRNPILSGQFYEPTILVNVDHCMRITQEEQFAPVMVIIRVGSDEEAVRLANDCPYGLGSSVFTTDPARGRRLATALRAGMTVVNDYGLAYMIQSLPFGGVGLSGFGRINGREGLRACCYTKALVTDRIALGRGVSVYPVHQRSFAVVQSAVKLLYQQGVRRKLRAAADLVADLWQIAKDRRQSDSQRLA